MGGCQCGMTKRRGWLAKARAGKKTTPAAKQRGGAKYQKGNYTVLATAQDTIVQKKNSQNQPQQSSGNAGGGGTSEMKHKVKSEAKMQSQMQSQMQSKSRSKAEQEQSKS